jgi:hypothetical protein
MKRTIGWANQCLMDCYNKNLFDFTIIKKLGF